VRGWGSRPVEGLAPPTNPWRSLAVSSRERSFLPWVYGPLRGSPPMYRRNRSLPRFLSHRRFRRSPHSSLRSSEDMSTGFGVCPVHQLCARGKPRALASLGFLTSKSGGLWRVCSRTSAMPLGRFHQRRLSDSSFARSVPTPGDGRSLVFRETGSDLPFLFRTPPPAETRDPPLRPSAGVGSPEVCRGFRM
jgi:hypothetical protein